MKLEDYLPRSVQTLQDAGVGTARLDILVLMEDLLGRDRAHLLAHPEMELTDEQTSVLNEQINRRMGHEPLAYIRGKTEFYGRDFIVNKYVLEPRPESETMIDLVKQLPNPGRMAIIDVGTGSGALAVTTKLEIPAADVWAIDIDPNCLETAEQNAGNLNAEITPLQGNLLDPITENPPERFALLCNLPYVPDSFHINQAAGHEPRLAIFGGRDGLDVYRALFTQIDTLSIKPAFVLTEAMPPQHEQLAVIARNHGYVQQKREDFIQIFAPSLPAKD